MNEETEEKKRPGPHFSLTAMAFILGSIPAARIIAVKFGPADDYFGYGAAGLALATLFVMHSIGLILAGGSLYRRERPALIAVIAGLVTGGTLLWLGIEMLFYF